MHRDDYDDRINKLIKPFKVFYDGKKSKMIDEDFFELLDGFDKKTRCKQTKQLTLVKHKIAIFYILCWQ